MTRSASIALVRDKLSKEWIGTDPIEITFHGIVIATIIPSGEEVDRASQPDVAKEVPEPWLENPSGGGMVQIRPFSKDAQAGKRK